MKNDDLFRDGVGQAPADQSQTARSAHRDRGDFREVVFKGMSRRTVWLCR